MSNNCRKCKGVTEQALNGITVEITVDKKIHEVVVYVCQNCYKLFWDQQGSLVTDTRELSLNNIKEIAKKVYMEKPR